MSNEELQYQFTQIIAECAKVALGDSQVILQLLVKKGIVTREEVDETRALVADKCEAVTGLTDIIDIVESKHNETNDLKNYLENLYMIEKI